MSIDVNKLIKGLEKEIVATQEGIEQTESLNRLKQVALTYAGEDKIIPFSEIKSQILAQKDEEKIMSGYKGLDDLLRGFRPQQLVVVSALTKSGKCLAKGTEVLMYDGSLKKVEKIEIGDKIMGEDSKPKNVLALGNGKEKMYKIEQRGASYIVNKSHILSLKQTGNRNFSYYKGKLTSSRYSKGKIVNISVEDYLKSSNSFKHRFKGYKTGTDFNEKSLPIDPYFFGLWLGDGTSSCVDITSADNEIRKYLLEYSKELGLDYHELKEKSKAYKCIISRSGKWGKRISLQEKLKQINVLNNKHIPREYLINLKENRLKLLAGLIDSDGHITKSKYPYIDYITKSEQLSKDIYFLASSLGFQVVVTSCKKGIKERNFIGDYFRISISGDLSKIPTKIKRKQSKFKPQREVLSSSIKVTPIGVGEYYGFELDGNGLFVLGNFVVTHNTSFLMDMTSHMKEQCPTWFAFEESPEELIRKFIERGEEPPEAFTPQNIKGNTVEWLEKKIVESIAKYNTKVIFIDQLDFIVPMRGDNHSLMIGQTMRDLKGLAKKWNVVIFIICHLTKAKMDTQPTLEDLKGSSSIGQEADTVILLWRETKREGGQVVITDNVNVSVQANRRFGKTGNVKMVYKDGHFVEQEWESEKSQLLENYKMF